MNRKNRFAALLLCLALLCSMLPQLSLTAHAETYSGECGADGDNLTWTLDSNTGVLTISGSGEMENYYEWTLPWSGYLESITSVRLPAGLTYIGNNAFNGCSGVTDISLPASLTGIGDRAFKGTGLTQVSIPASLTSLGAGTFSECAGLTSVSLPAGMVTVSWCCFFNCTGLESVTLPSSLEFIEGYAFSGCTGLTGISVPSGVVSLGEGAFSGCTGLTGITLPASVTILGESVFSGCTGLKTMSFPANLKQISASAFSGCTGLTGVTLHNNMTTIEDEAFANCESLTAITLPDSIKTIGQGAFSGSGLKSVTIPKGVTKILQDTFLGCASLTSVTFPESLLSIGWRAFMDCPKLTKVAVPESVVGINDLSLGYVTGADGAATPLSGFTVCGYVGSMAESYAQQNGFTFVSLGGVRNPFEDVSSTDFFYNPVMWALEHDITGGVDETHFAPYNTVMRADAMLFFWAAKGRPAFTATSKTFKDVGKKHWAYSAVMWAVENGITGGTDAAGTMFSPQKTCSRSEILQFLYAAEGKPKYSISNPYTDVKNKHWYKDGAIWAYENGLEKGSDGKFSAKTPCTRAYVVLYLYRYITKQQLAQ